MPHSLFTWNIKTFRLIKVVVFLLGMTAMLLLRMAFHADLLPRAVCIPIHAAIMVVSIWILSLKFQPH